MKARNRPDPLERSIEAALRPGHFVAYNASWSFVEDLEEVEAGAAALIASEPARAAELYETLSHFVTEPAAAKLEKAHPDLAARLWRAQGLRIVNAGKSKYYDAALRNVESAKRCFERAGLAAEWQRTVAAVRTRHGRKSGFLPGFEALAAGRGPSTEPTFLGRAKARWQPARRR
ncbi:MAG: hypothetical protein ACYDA8_11435 [Deferrisomatales bacterium]